MLNQILHTKKSTSQYASLLGVHPQTLRRYERVGKIQCERTVGNHRRFAITTSSKSELITVGYARVSSHDQKQDLERQTDDIKDKSNPDMILSDVGSGLNYKKPGFRQLILLLLSGKVRELVLAHKDRLLRFGSEIIFLLCKHLGVKITILYEEEVQEPTQRFCQDMVEIIPVFCSKIYGQRSHKNRRANQKNKHLPHSVNDNAQLYSSL